MNAPYYPTPYQINTRVWLTDLSRSLGRRATLDDIPDSELDAPAQKGFDYAYDKQLYDRLRGHQAPPVRGQLRSQSKPMPRSLAFPQSRRERMAIVRSTQPSQLRLEWRRSAKSRVVSGLVSLAGLRFFPGETRVN